MTTNLHQRTIGLKLSHLIQIGAFIITLFLLALEYGCTTSERYKNTTSGYDSSDASALALPENSQTLKDSDGFTQYAKSVDEVLSIRLLSTDSPVVIANCDFDGDGIKDDILYVIPNNASHLSNEYATLITVDNDGNETSVTLSRGIGSEASKSITNISISNLGTEEKRDYIIIGLESYSSNYASTDVHVLRVENGEFNDILTVFDGFSSGAEQFDEAIVEKYKNSTFDIPEPKDNFDLPDDYPVKDYRPGTQICSGVVVPNTHDSILKGTIIIKHIQRYGIVPYTVLAFDGVEWSVIQQRWKDEKEFYRCYVM